MTEREALWNHGEEHGPSFTCPREECGATSHHPMDVRYGYCWRCHDFTGEPTAFIFAPIPGRKPTPEQVAFSERVKDAVRHRFEAQPVRMLTDEERAALHERNLAAFRYEERMALSIVRPRRRRRWYDAMVRAFCLSTPC